MMLNLDKEALKELLGDLPLAAELYWLLRQSDEPPVGGYELDQLKTVLPDWIAQTNAASRLNHSGKKVFIFTMLKYWVEQTTMLALALSALGNEVTLAYLPYAKWQVPINRFDLRRQSLYMRDALEPVESLVKLINSLDLPKAGDIPEALAEQMDAAGASSVFTSRGNCMVAAGGFCRVAGADQFSGAFCPA